jgi:hypothetical protein
MNTGTTLKRSANLPSIPGLILIFLTIFIAGMMLASCNSPSKKVENAEENVKDAQEKLDKANMEYREELVNYRIETSRRIAENDSTIARLKAKIAEKKKDAREDYMKRVAVLEQKNSELKHKMDNYKDEGKDNWERFKTEFNHDMDELGQAFKDLTVRNTDSTKRHKK